MSAQADQPVMKEAVGVFVDATALREAASALLRSNFDRQAPGLLAGEHTVARALGDIYIPTREFSDDRQAPCTAFVRDEPVDDTTHAWAWADGLTFLALPPRRKLRSRRRAYSGAA